MNCCNCVPVYDDRAHDRFESEAHQTTKSFIKKSLKMDLDDIVEALPAGKSVAAARALADLIQYQRCLQEMQDEAAMIVDNLVDIIKSSDRN